MSLTKLSKEDLIDLVEELQMKIKSLERIAKGEWRTQQEIDDEMTKSKSGAWTWKR